MNSIERVKATLKFENPDRVPVLKFFGKSDVFMMARIPSLKWQPTEEGLFPHLGHELIIKSELWKWDMPDWAKDDPKYKRNKWLKLEREEIDEWGNIWKMGGIETMGHPVKPRLLDYKDMGEYLAQNTPIYDDEKSYSFYLDLKNKLGQNKYRLAHLELGPSQMTSQMRGFDRYLIDHRRNKTELKELLRYVTDQYILFEKQYVKNGLEPHGFILYDDLGEQNGPFWSPKTFREFYEPVYKRLIDTAHDLGCEFMLHCCGKVDPLIPIFIEWGLDALELDSPRMTGYSDLAQFRGKIAFFACLDIQRIYPLASPEDCEREVWHMVRNLGTQEGGFGAYFYPQVDHIQAPESNINAFTTGLEKYSVYANIPEHWWTFPVVNQWKSNEVPPLPS
ncbi:MAG: uroporphyrinogen decarboxylase family protein [Candidatus Heimdallarchaeota archaeon]